ncbi:MAG: Efflux transporter RND family MFP [Geobacteraceae bacterium]|nr:MAG: Efflux transporter RND family MFP [Geobacteraceae bacterium]
MRNGRFGILIIVFLIVVAVVFAISTPLLFKKKPAVPLPSAQKIDGTVVTAKGVVESGEEIELSSRVTGTVRKVMVDEGDTVKKGEPLVIFDTTKAAAQVKQAEAGLAEAQARLRELSAGYRPEDVEMAQSNLSRTTAVHNQAKDEYEREQRLYKKDATTLIELQRAEEKMKVAREQAREAQANLQKYRKGARVEEIEQARGAVERAASELQFSRALLAEYTINSPINGLVVEWLKDAGETMDVGTPVLKLMNPSELRIRAELEETDVGKVGEGQSVEVSIDSYQGKIFKGRVAKVFSVVQKKSQKTFDPMASFDINTQKIHIVLDDYTGLKNGMTVTVKFQK